jgi:hypothetical protein
VSYSAVGSSAGIAAINARQVDFGASDVPMNARELAAAKGGPVTQVPDALGAEGIAYHLDLPAGARLRLTGPVLAAIFLGQITRWNDPAVTALNPGITLPGAPITVVHRSDGSGTTYIFSNYLSSVSPAWAASPGTGKTLTWPVGEGAKGNDRVTSSIVNQPGASSYPISGYSVRGKDFTAPLTFAFPGREVQATQVRPRPGARHGKQDTVAARSPGTRGNSREPGPAGNDAARMQLSGDFLLRPGHEYSVMLLLTGTPAGGSRPVPQEGSLTGGKIIPAPRPEPGSR